MHYEISCTGKRQNMHYQICICRAGNVHFILWNAYFGAPAIRLHTCDSAGMARTPGKYAFPTMECIFWGPPIPLHTCWHGPDPRKICISYYGMHILGGWLSLYKTCISYYGMHILGPPPSLSTPARPRPAENMHFILWNANSSPETDF